MGRLWWQRWVVANQACFHRFAHFCAEWVPAGTGSSGHVTETHGELAHSSEVEPECRCQRLSNADDMWQPVDEQEALRNATVGLASAWQFASCDPSHLDVVEQQRRLEEPTKL